MIQVFVDESYTESVFSMGGYIATCEHWEQFWTDWETTCKEPPAIDYFEFSEWRKRCGQFHRFKDSTAKSKMLSLYKVITDHVDGYVSVAIDRTEYIKLFNNKQFPRPIRNPYYCGLLSIMTNLPTLLIESGLTGPVEFIFDRQVMEEQHILEVWYAFEAEGLIDRNLIKSAPQFKDDREVLPLQAADMLAGRMRLALQENLGIVPPLPVILIIGQPLIKGHHLVWGTENLRRLHDFMILSQQTVIRGRFGTNPFITIDTERMREYMTSIHRPI